MLLNIARSVFVGLALVATGAATDPLAGLKPLLSPGTVLLLGQLHGTVEAPRFVTSVVEER